MYLKRIHQFFQNFPRVLLIIFFTISFIQLFGNIEILASIKAVSETPDFMPVGTIVLDEQSIQEIIYISSDRSILVFRNITPQLNKLQPGDVLFIQAMEDKIVNSLFQVSHIIREKSNHQGMMVEVFPWENRPPLISALIAQPSTVEVSQPIHLTCHAADQDGELLHYTWISSGGTMVGNGPAITWIAPEQAGHYDVSCIVQDQHGDRTVKSIQLTVVKKLPLFTEQEKELIRRFGWSSNRIIRWPDGDVPVYDSTHFGRMQEVLDEWNKVIGGKVIFYLSNNPQSPVKISYNYELSRTNLCSHIDTHWRNYRLYAAEIQINPDSRLCGFPRNLYAAYLHCFSGVAGFNVWQGITVEREDWQNFTHISEVMQRMIKALYNAQPGYDLSMEQ